MASTSWLVEVADVFLTSVLKYGHLWLLRRELVEALMGLDATLHFMPNGVDVSGLFDAALSLLRRFRNVVTETTLRDQGGRRGFDRISCRAPRLSTAPSGGGQPRAEAQGNKAGYPVAPVTWERELVAPSVCQLRGHLVLRDERIYHSE